MVWESMSQINLIFQSLGEWLFYPMRFFSFLGDEEFYLFIMPAIYWCFDSLLGFKLGMLLMASNAINGVLKILFISPRPFWVNNKVVAYVQETSFGAPSGHSQHAVVIWGYLASIVKKGWVKTLFILTFLLIGFSRIYLGAHFVWDVLLGWLIGFGIVILFIWINRNYSVRIRQWSKKKKIAITVLISFLIIFLGWVSVAIHANWEMPELYQQNVERVFLDKEINPLSLNGIITASATWMGLVLGVILTEEKIPLGIINSDLTKKLIRFLVGLIGVILLWAGLKFIFPEDIPFVSETLRFFRYFLVGIWISGGAPVLFKKLNL